MWSRVFEPYNGNDSKYKLGVDLKNKVVRDAAKYEPY
jgi:hypothetical protein